ncbi:hypothetical protein BKP35_18285 [Anaerobacillus arseniciselenatis]|uniref:Uncharacterized protein n=1 Tax=Anaerobacillus arseniciselenatis TaxID=85682 RepID=A0A1S2L7S9_9BACI|nr:hypothetical protein BKP35_18285 [Anaerobacillus arseniciselenatis]
MKYHLYILYFLAIANVICLIAEFPYLVNLSVGLVAIIHIVTVLLMLHLEKKKCNDRRVKA